MAASPSGAATATAAASAAVSPGHRASALMNIFNEALAHTVKTISYDNFAACFPTTARSCRDSLRSVWQQMIGRFEELARSEFDDILRERDVVRLLNELDAMVTRAWREKESAGGEEKEKAGRPLAPHTLPPSTILAAHLAPYLAQQQADLDTRIQATEAQNVVLTDTIGAQHEEIHRLLGQLQGLVGDLNGAADALDGVVRPDDFPREIERMNDEMTPANARMKELSSG